MLCQLSYREFYYSHGAIAIHTDGYLCVNRVCLILDVSIVLVVPQDFHVRVSTCHGHIALVSLLLFEGEIAIGIITCVT